MSLPPITGSLRTEMARLGKLLSRDAELGRTLAAQTQMEGLLIAARRAAAAGDCAQLRALSDQARQLSQDVMAGCGASPGREAQTVAALGKAVETLCRAAEVSRPSTRR